MLWRHARRVSSAMPRRASQEGQTVIEQRILAASRERFASFGYRHTSIAEIARDAGVATGTVYRYFASKEDLFRRVVQDLNERWVELARSVLSGPGAAHERLARLGPASIEFNRSNKLLTSILNRDTEIIHAPLLDDIRRDLIRENVTLMAEVIRDAIAEGSMRPVDPEQAAFIVFVAGQTLFTQEDRAYQEVLPLFVDIVLHGLRTG